MTHVLESLDASIVAVTKNKTKIGTNRNNPFPGWKDDVKRFRETAMFWHAIWVSAGKP